ncbi:MAG: hypothetical protein V3T88_03210 [Nitrosomonadaceae bacterium]
MGDKVTDYLMLNCYHMVENPVRRKPRFIPKRLWLKTYQRWYSKKIDALIFKDMGIAKSLFNEAKLDLKKEGLY